MTVLKDQFPRGKEQKIPIHRKRRRLEEDRRLVRNFMGLALTFSPHHTAPHSTARGFYGIISWQNTEFRDAQSTTNPPGLLQNRLSHRGTNAN